MSEGHSQTAGFSPEPGNSSVRWRNIGATQLPDGSWALKVDTELVLDGANVNISNIKVGSVDQTTAQLRFLKTLDDGTVVVSGTIATGVLLESYTVTDSIDTGAFPRYHGYTNEDEDWFIIEEDKVGSVTTLRYFAGTGNYNTAWTARGTHPYDYYFNIF